MSFGPWPTGGPVATDVEVMSVKLGENKERLSVELWKDATKMLPSKSTTASGTPYSYT